MSATSPVIRPRFGFSQAFDLLGISLIHIFTVVAFVRGPTWRLVGLAAALYFLRMFAITGAYHRYFAHRSYKTSRAFQLVLALLGTTATQKGPLWWASTHRFHHKHSDQPADPHSPKQGFFHSHMGWWLGPGHEATRWDLIPDFARFPELRFLDRFHVIGVALIIFLTAYLGGWDGFLWGYVVSTCFLMHGTFTINSLAHVFGSRRYATRDTSRNNFWLALITMGEGWHNNHHHYAASTRQGFFWWEIDATYYVLKALSWIGLVRDLREPPARVLVERGEDADESAPALDTLDAPAEPPSQLPA